jgi:octaprenyl-diphosphate synthase
MTSQGGVAGLAEIADLVGEDLARVEDFLEEQAGSDIPLIAEVGRHVREGGGKRIRPALVLLSCRACGYRGDRAILLAGVVELIHSASLVHDDVVDEADERRGRRSVHRRWGNGLAVLFGDFLFSKSMSLALTQDDLRVLTVLSEATLRMVEGQLLEIEACADLHVTADAHLDLIRRKTASLFSACLRIGAILGVAGEPRERALGAYGSNLGLCFQMVDDLLDLTADPKRLGKPVASDLRAGKLTLPLIFTLRRAGAAGLEMVRAVLEDRAFDRVAPHEVVRLARECGALEEARLLAERYADAARGDLLACERSPYREALALLPDFVLARDH